MQITFSCASCQTHLQIEASAAGAEIRCPKCQASQTVPQKGLGPGVTVGGFLITRLLGKGGMGEVYLARQLSLDRDVALKILPHTITADKETVERFLNEVRILAKLEHPNIVTAYEAGVDDGVYYLAMGYVRGETLADYLKKRGPLPEAEALRLVAKLSGAMGYAWHKHQIIHRDIKPANIILDEAGEPKLADLGLTKSLREGGGLTLSGTIMGTPSYMSPEQVEGKQDLDFRADIYALGATLYHMMTGKIPFEATTLMESLRKQATETLPDPRQVVPAVSEGCARLLARMLAKVPGDRYPNWEALGGDLQRVSAGQLPVLPLLAAGKSVVCVTHPAGVAKASGAGSPADVVSQARHAAPPREDTERQVRRVATAVTVAVVLVIGIAVWWVERGKRKAVTATATAAEQAAGATLARATAVPAAGVAQGNSTRRPTAVATNTNPVAGERIAAAGARGDVPARAQAVGHPRDRAATAPPPVAVTPSGGGLPQPPGATNATITPAKSRGPPREPVTATPAVTEWKPTDVLNRLADCMLKQDWDAVSRLVRETDTDPRARECAEWVAIKTAACEVARMPEVIAESLVQDKGRRVAVAFKSGNEDLEISDVAGGRIKADKLFEVDGNVVGRAPLEFGISDLTLKEKLKRLGSERTAARQVMRGLLAWEAGSPDAALRLFRECGGPEGAWLAARVDRLRAEKAEAEAAAVKAVQEQAAQKYYSTLLQDAGMPADGKSDEAMVRELRKKRFTEAEVQKIRQNRTAFLNKHGATALAARVMPVIDVLAQIRPNASLDVDKAAVEAALDALKKANPNELFNRSPVYLDDGIKLDLGGMKGLKDITALTGLPIVELTLSGTEVPDLRPLAGMPLRVLRANSTRIADLRALIGMPLRELHLQGTPVKDLRPLAGLPLTDLRISNTQVSDLWPLKGAPLTVLMADWCGGINDLAPLRGMPLKKASVSGTSVDDLRPLQGMGLVELNVGTTPVSDLSPLKDLPITVLSVAWTKVTDLSPLRGMRLSRLDISATGVSDLSPLNGMPLTTLSMSGTRVTDMRPVKDIPNLTVHR